MPRMRTIKPEYQQSYAIVAMPPILRLHFAVLWTYADDEGRGIDDPRLIKAAVWPLDDDVTFAQVDEWQADLARFGRLVRYEYDGKRFFEIHGFTEHQKPNRKVDSKCPSSQLPGVVLLPVTAGAVSEQCGSSESAVNAHERLTPVVGDGDVDGDVGRARIVCGERGPLPAGVKGAPMPEGLRRHRGQAS